MVGIVALNELSSLQLLEPGQHLFLIGRHIAGKRRLRLAAPYQIFQLHRRLLMIIDHLLRKSLRLIIAPLQSKLTGFDFEHVAARRFIDEILRRRCGAYERIDSCLFGSRLGEGAGGVPLPSLFELGKRRNVPGPFILMDTEDQKYAAKASFLSEHKTGFLASTIVSSFAFLLSVSSHS